MAWGQGGEMLTIVLLLLTACDRPTDDYPVRVNGAGTRLQDIQAPPTEMSGRIELARYRLWGSNLGYGQTGIYGDAPRADGTSFVVGSAHFGYPAITAFDRVSAFLSPGPAAVDTCLVRIPSAEVGPTEYVDVGDRVRFSTDGVTHVSLERDPTAHPRPAGESWYVGYGQALLPLVQDHADLADTWTPGGRWTLTFPGTVVPAESTLGAVPYPLTDGEVVLPDGVEGLSINGDIVRPPHHGYSADGEWTGEEDDVRFVGPFVEPMVIGWTPSVTQGPLTITIRLLGAMSEGSCGCESDCGDGFRCESGQCIGVDGSGANPLVELSCTADDDGEFVLHPEDLAGLWTATRWDDIRGATLSAGRMNEGRAEMRDILTWNGKRVRSEGVRTRALDVLVTRLEWP